MKYITALITLLILCFANVQAQKILKPKWSTNHVSQRAHFNNSGTKLLVCGGNCVDVWDIFADTLLFSFTNTTRITDAKFSNDGTKIAAVTALDVLYIINSQNGETIHELSEGIRLNYINVEFNKNDTQVLAVSNTNIAQIWNIESGDFISRVYATNNSKILSGSFSHSGSFVILQHQNYAEIFETQNGTSVKRLYHPGMVHTAKYDNTDERVLTASYEKGIKMWDVKTGEEIYSLAFTNSTSKAEFSPDCKYFLHTTSENEIVIRETSTGEKITTLKSDRYGGILSVHFNGTGEYVLCTEYYGTAKLWNVRTGKLSHTFPIINQLQAEHSEFDASGKRFLTASSDGVVTIWDTVTKNKILEHNGISGGNTYPTFSISGKRIIVGSQDNIVKVWDTENGNLEMLDFQYQIYDRDKFVQLCSNNTFASSTYDSKVRIRDADSLDVIHEIPNTTTVPKFLPACNQIIYQTFANNGLEVYDLKKNSVVAKLEDSKSLYLNLRISPSGDIAIVKQGDVMYVWSLQNGSLLRIIGLTQGLDFTEFIDNKTVLVQSFNPFQLQWIDIEQGNVIHTSAMPFAVSSVRLTEDKSKLIGISSGIIGRSGMKEINILDARNGNLLRAISTDTIVYSVDFNDKDSLMITAGVTGLTVYNTVTMKKIGQSVGYGLINYVKFSKKGDRFVTADNDGTIRMWSTIDEKPPIIPTDSTTQFTLFPNPATDEITIKGISSTSPVAYTFTDLVGNTIHSGFIPEQTDTYTLSTGNLPPGFYNVTFQMNGAKHTEKLTVVH